MHGEHTLTDDVSTQQIQKIVGNFHNILVRRKKKPKQNKIKHEVIPEI